MVCIYHFVDLLTGEVRYEFFTSYLLRKQFKTLAYSWNPTIVSIFIQILLFKGSLAKVDHIEHNVFTPREEQIYSLQETYNNLTPIALDIKIFKTIKRRFERYKIEKLTQKEIVYLTRTNNLYYYFCNLYNEWQNSGKETLPDLEVNHFFQSWTSID